MPTYSRQTRVAAPLDRVWSFHSRIEGLTALTPDWFRLRVESIRGPDGRENPDTLVAGTRLRLSVSPLGIGPRQRWVSVITKRESGDGWARFQDRMESGPFRRWHHTHRFRTEGDATVVTDRVEYDLPGGAVGRALAPLVRVGLEPTFRYRHRRTRTLLEEAGGNAD